MCAQLSMDGLLTIRLNNTACGFFIAMPHGRQMQFDQSLSQALTEIRLGAHCRTAGLVKRASNWLRSTGATLTSVTGGTSSSLKRYSTASRLLAMPRLLLLPLHVWPTLESPGIAATTSDCPSQGTCHTPSGRPGCLNISMQQRDGLLTRELFPEVPLRVEYELTMKGEDYFPAVRASAGGSGCMKKAASGMKYRPTMRRRFRTSDEVATALATFAAMINATCSPRGNVPSDQLAPGGRRPGMAAPTLDTQGEAR
jgi:HxlR-like helix-turn-helix